MAASDNLSRQFQVPRQLTLFEPAGKLALEFTSTEGHWHPGGQEGMRAEKLRDAHRAPPSSAWSRMQPGIHSESFYENVRREGVKEPVRVGYGGPDPDDPSWEGRPLVFDGNHRVAVAYDVDPAMEVPVEWVG